MAAACRPAATKAEFYTVYRTSCANWWTGPGRTDGGGDAVV